jgi:hypothetical protein
MGGGGEREVQTDERKKVATNNQGQLRSRRNGKWVTDTKVTVDINHGTYPKQKLPAFHLALGVHLRKEPHSDIQT